MTVSQGQPTKPPATDSITLDRYTVEQLVIHSKQKKILEQKVTLLESDKQILQEQIASKQREIGFIEARDSLLLKAKLDEIAAMEKQMAIYDKGLADLQKALKKERRKSRFIGIAGIFVSAATFFIGSEGLK